MGDRLQVIKRPQYFTKPSRPTQSPILSGTGNWVPAEMRWRSATGG